MLMIMPQLTVLLFNLSYYIAVKNHRFTIDVHKSCLLAVCYLFDYFTTFIFRMIYYVLTCTCMCFYIFNMFTSSFGQFFFFFRHPTLNSCRARRTVSVNLTVTPVLG